jgi:hypothetical protein
MPAWFASCSLVTKGCRRKGRQELWKRQNILSIDDLIRIIRVEERTSVVNVTHCSLFFLVNKGLKIVIVITRVRPDNHLRTVIERG